MFHIYMFVSKQSGNVYVGQTRMPETRKRQHTYDLSKGKHKNAHFQRAWNLYGESEFDHFYLADFDTKADVDDAERFYIAWFRELNLCYNHMGGGEGNYQPDEETRRKFGWSKGKKLTEEQKAALKGRKPAMTGLKHSEEAKSRMSEAHTGKVLSPEHKAKLAAALQKRVFTPEYRAKLSEAAKGNTHSKGRKMPAEQQEKLRAANSRPKSEEHKQKIADTLRGRPLADETKRKISETTKGRPGKPLSEETKQKIREARAKQVMKPVSEETSQKISEAKKGWNPSEETRERMRQAALRRYGG
jgi:group I intron endonuclease